ncbi:MAG: adenylate/guanylate cyclase domain-containing protein [Saprospiraceae bacterium]
MKYSYTFFITLIAAALFAQTGRITSLEKSLAGKSGLELVKDYRQLSEWYFEEGLYKRAAERARQAFGEAKKMGWNQEMALALNREGKALVKIPGRRNTFKNKAFKSFMQSNSLTRDKDLRLGNLHQLKALATALGREKELQAIIRDIAAARENGARPNAVKGGLFGRKRRALRQQNEALASELGQMSEQQAALQKMVQKKEAAIQDLSAEQMKKELLLSEQERMLDSLTFTSILDSLELAHKEYVVREQDAELEKLDAELALRESQRNLFLAIAGLILLAAAGLFHRYHVMRRHNSVLEEKNKIIVEERQRSEELLLNILPMAVAEELKKNGFAEARQYDSATVLFTDFQGFSKISKKLAPGKLVQDLHYAFTHFDHIIGQYGLEKIKTIGDAYMCAGGLPRSDAAAPLNVVKAALEIQRFLDGWNRERRKNGEPVFEARIGIHTGPLVAGVVGEKKFAYDIWGDTVNVASRMESNGKPGKVNISAATFAHVKKDFDCEYRGKVPAKNVGEVEMYFVKAMRA